MAAVHFTGHNIMQAQYTYNKVLKESHVVVMEVCVSNILTMFVRHCVFLFKAFKTFLYFYERWESFRALAIMGKCISRLLFLTCQHNFSPTFHQLPVFN